MKEYYSILLIKYGCFDTLPQIVIHNEQYKFLKKDAISFKEKMEKQFPQCTYQLIKVKELSK